MYDREREQDARAYHPGKFEYMVLDLRDDTTETLFRVLPEALEFIEEGIACGGVLVHCNAGKSRYTVLAGL